MQVLRVVSVEHIDYVAYRVEIFDTPSQTSIDLTPEISFEQAIEFAKIQGSLVVESGSW